MTQLVLVVGTHRVNRERLVQALERASYAVEPAEAEEEACLQLDQGRYDAVLVDLQPPGAAGLELLRAVKARCGATPVIAARLRESRRRAAQWSCWARPEPAKNWSRGRCINTVRARGGRLWRSTAAPSRIAARERAVRLRARRLHRWPGNVRELEHAIEEAVAVARRPIITRDDLPIEIVDARRPRVDPRMRAAALSKGATDEHDIPFTAG
jgi:DNA-binding NtrC family response regulator